MYTPCPVSHGHFVPTSIKHFLSTLVYLSELIKSIAAAHVLINAIGWLMEQGVIAHGNIVFSSLLACELTFPAGGRLHHHRLPLSAVTMGWWSLSIGFFDPATQPLNLSLKNIFVLVIIRTEGAASLADRISHITYT